MKILRELTSIKYLRLTRRSISLIVFNNWRTIEITVISPMSGNIMNTYTACKTSIIGSHPLPSVQDRKCLWPIAQNS